MIILEFLQVTECLHRVCLVPSSMISFKTRHTFWGNSIEISIFNVQCFFFLLQDYECLTPLLKILCYIVAVRFICEENWEDLEKTKLL